MKAVVFTFVENRVAPRLFECKSFHVFEEAV